MLLGLVRNTRGVTLGLSLVPWHPQRRPKGRVSPHVICRRTHFESLKLLKCVWNKNTNVSVSRMSCLFSLIFSLISEYSPFPPWWWEHPSNIAEALCPSSEFDRASRAQLSASQSFIYTGYRRDAHCPSPPGPLECATFVPVLGHRNLGQSWEPWHLPFSHFRCTLKPSPLMGCHLPWQ